MWEFEQQAEGKKEEERSSREQKTQEDHVSPSTAFQVILVTIATILLVMKRIDPY